MTKARLVIDLTGDSKELENWLKEHLGVDASVFVHTPTNNFHVRLKESWLHGVIFDKDGFSVDFMRTTCDRSCGRSVQ